MITTGLFTFLPLAIIFLCFFETGNSIECYVCNTAEIYQNPYCGNSTALSKGMGNKYIVNCSTLPTRDGATWDRCRTIVQDVEGEVRTIRSCATVGDKNKENRCVDRTGTAKIKIRYCECNDKNLCNGVSVIIPSIVTIIVALIITILH